MCEHPKWQTKRSDGERSASCIRGKSRAQRDWRRPTSRDAARDCPLLIDQRSGERVLALTCAIPSLTINSLTFRHPVDHECQALREAHGAKDAPIAILVGLLNVHVAFEN